MLFLVISSPYPSRPEDTKTVRLEFRHWIKSLEAQKKVLYAFPKVCRGYTAVFDVSSNEELHEYLTSWSDIIPVSFEILPLVSPEVSEKMLGGKHIRRDSLEE